MIVYHASDMEGRSPEIRKTVYAKDFGSGFYCTLNYAQAERWARLGSVVDATIADAERQIETRKKGGRG